MPTGKIKICWKCGTEYTAKTCPKCRKERNLGVCQKCGSKCSLAAKICMKCYRNTGGLPVSKLGGN